MQIHSLDTVRSVVAPKQDATPAVGAAAAAPSMAAMSPAKLDLAEATPQSPAAHDVRAAVVEANKTMKAINASLQFTVDPETDTTVIKVVDESSNTVIRQIPAQEMLDIAQALGKMKGVLLKQQA